MQALDFVPGRGDRERASKASYGRIAGGAPGFESLIPHCAVGDQRTHSELPVLIWYRLALETPNGTLDSVPVSASFRALGERVMGLESTTFCENITDFYKKSRQTACFAGNGDHRPYPIGTHFW
jgi:hypothetical protein